jgi:hypothetical protein
MRGMLRGRGVAVKQMVGRMKGAANVNLETAKWRRKDGGKREFAGAGEEQADGKQEFREGVFHAPVADVVTIREMDHENGAAHDDDDADAADTHQRAEKDSDAAGELSEADEVADDVGCVHEGGEVVRAGSAESAEEDSGAVVDEWQRASEAHDEEFEI